MNLWKQFIHLISKGRSLSNAKEELKSVFDAGIVLGTAPGIFSLDENVTTDQMKLFIDRVHALLK